MADKDIRIPGDKLEIEGVVHPLCDEWGREGICVEDASKPNKYNEPTEIVIGSDYANSCSTVYDWLDKTLSYYHLWDTEVTVRITVEVLAINRKPSR